MNPTEPLIAFIKTLRTQRSGYLTLIFLLLFFTFEEVAFGGAQLKAIAKIYFEPWVASGGINEPHSPIPGIFSILTLVITFFAIKVSFNSSGKLKWLYFALFVLAALVQYGYWSALNRHFVISDFRTSLTSPLHFWVDSISRFFNPNALYLSLVYGGFLFFVNTETNHKFKHFTFLTLLIITLGASSHWIGHPNFASLSIPAFYKSLSQVVIGETRQSSERIEVPPISMNPPANNIVLIIDESVRGENLSLYGYGRETTPIFEKLHDEGKLHFWPDTISGATCSVISNAIILTGLNELPDQKRNLHTNPTIFQYAKAMGYTTHYIDGQSSSLWNSLKPADLFYVDSYLNRSRLKYPDPKTMDGLIGDHLANALDAQTGQFFVINKVGVHAPYTKAFPEGELIWSDAPPNLAHDSFFDIVNNYDSAILYNHTTFFEPLAAKPQILENTIIVYTSDHGQNLGEFPEKYFHCSKEKVEVEIPLAIIGNLDQEGVDSGFKAHHENIFPTLLDLMGVPTENRLYDYSISLLEATGEDSQPRSYLPSSSDFFTGETLLYDE